MDAGGGGTIAFILALYGMNVIDSGVPVLSMHSPWEAVSKADLYETYRGYKAFLRNASEEHLARFSRGEAPNAVARLADKSCARQEVLLMEQTIQ